MPARSFLSGIAAVAVLLTLSLPATGAGTGSPTNADERTGQRAGASGPSERRKADQKRRRRCRGLGGRAASGKQRDAEQQEQRNPARRDVYLRMYGNICYDTRDQYVNFPWSSERR